MTSSTANTSSQGLLDTPFSMAATAVAVIAALLAVVFAWTGYTDGALPLIGQLNILTGMIGLLFGWGIALVAFVAAAYMEPGFDH